VEDATLGKWVRVERELNSMQALKHGEQNSAALPNELGPAKSVVGGLIAGLAGVLPGSTAGALSGLGIFETRYLFYRRSRRTDVASKVVDVQIVQQGQTPPDGNLGWHRVKEDLRPQWMRVTGQTGTAHLYFRTAGNSSFITARNVERAPAASGEETHAERAAESMDPITEVDVIYGPNEPMPGFQFAGEIVHESQAMFTPAARLAIRRKPISPPELPTPITFKKDGTFKILQLADLHYGIQHDECRDVPDGVKWAHSSGSKCEGDSETIPRIEQWLDAEKPDLVVLTGDQFNGQQSSWDERSVIMKVIKPMVDRKIMWAAILGNHDSQSGILSRRQLQSLLQAMPYSKTFVGPEAMHGTSNFYLKLHSPTPDKMELANLYFFDSGAWVPKEESGTGWGSKAKDRGGSEYDYIHSDQIRWFEDRVQKAKKLVRPYEPDGAKDLDKLWDRTSPATTPAVRMEKRVAHQRSTMRKPLGIAFMHIPIPEAFNEDVDKDPTTGKELIYGERLEIKSTRAGGQSHAGFFDTLMKQDAAGERDVELLVHGHQHNNYDCRRIKGVWICFGGGSSFAGYGSRDLKRRSRVIMLEKWGEKVSTWQRFDDATTGEVSTLYELKA
jgi:Calcineurin-like phosphoesterase